MKIFQKFSQEIIPLSRKQTVITVVIIACIFQFALFFAPALADEAVIKAKAQISEKSPADSADDIIITTDSIVKESKMDDNAAKLAKPIASSTKIKIIRTSTHTITAYNSEAGQTDDSPFITANGYDLRKSVTEDTIAANFLKFGTKVMIPELFGDRVFVVRDRMNKRHASRVDVWMKDHSTAVKFGVKVAKIQVIETIE